MQRIFPRRSLPRWQGLLLAGAAAGLVWALRTALDPLLGGETPYMLFLLGVLAVSVAGGWQVGIVATVFSGLLANFSFVAPEHSLTFAGSQGWAFSIFISVALILVALVHALATTARRETTLREELATVSGEYRHRIKNLLVVAQSLVHQTGRTAATAPEFRDKLLDRLHALARAQDLLQVGDARVVPLRTLVDEILEPFNLEDRLAWPITGPDVLVPADTTIALALLLNELATNAMKHGALSAEEGRLKLGWVLQPDWTVIEWKEIDGPPVSEPLGAGFGSRLFENALPRASGTADLWFEPDGLRCEIRIRAVAR
jgi:two-component sensor histidine kinase